MENFVFPKLCFHCSERIEQQNRLLCKTCFDSLELIDPLTSCPRCFSSDYQKKSSCPGCYKKTTYLTALASVFEEEGPAGTLVRKLKGGDKPYLAESLAFFMTMQLFKLQWPLPDCIVPVPISNMRLFCRGYNQSLLLAEAMGRLLDRPVLQVLGRKSGEFSQTGLSTTQRHELKSDSLFLKKGKNIQDKKILLVDDVLATGSTLRASAEVMLAGCPQQIYGLTVCRKNF